MTNYDKQKQNTYLKSAFRLILLLLLENSIFAKLQDDLSPAKGLRSRCCFRIVAVARHQSLFGAPLSPRREIVRSRRNFVPHSFWFFRITSDHSPELVIAAYPQHSNSGLLTQFNTNQRAIFLQNTL